MSSDNPRDSRPQNLARLTMNPMRWHSICNPVLCNPVVLGPRVVWSLALGGFCQRLAAQDVTVTREPSRVSASPGELSQADLFEARIEQGALDPRDSAARIGGMSLQQAQSWWAFQPLHCVGLDHERLTYRDAGRDYRLTDVSGRVLREVLT